MLEELLQLYDVHTYTAYTGREALNLLQRLDRPPTFILSDIHMPDLDGIQLLQAIRANPQLSQIPVIAITAEALADTKTKLKSLGFLDYIPKPISDFASFMALLDSHFGDRN